jgi:hypothetical protein
LRGGGLVDQVLAIGADVGGGQGDKVLIQLAAENG